MYLLCNILYQGMKLTVHPCIDMYLDCDSICKSSCIAYQWQGLVFSVTFLVTLAVVTAQGMSSLCFESGSHNADISCHTGCDYSTKNVIIVF